MVMLASHYFPVIVTAENWISDMRIVLMTPAEPQSSEIVIVTATEDTMESLSCRSPMDRRFINQLLTTIEQQNPRLIGIDILFDQGMGPEANNGDTELSVSEKQLQATINKLRDKLVAVAGTRGTGFSDKQLDYQNKILGNANQASPIIIADGTDGIIRKVLLSQKQKPHYGFAALLANLAGIPVPAESDGGDRISRPTYKRTDIFPHHKRP